MENSSLEKNKFLKINLTKCNCAGKYTHKYIFNQIFFVMNLKRNQILCSTNSAPNEYDKKSLTLILLILLWDLIPFSTIF